MTRLHEVWRDPQGRELRGAELDALRRRLHATRWPEAEPVDDWSQGIPLAYMRDICEYWADEYDWRPREAALNRFDQVVTEIDGDEYRGLMKVKVGPIVAKYQGTATFTARDDENRVATIKAAGRDPRQGNADAEITAALNAESESVTRVDLVTELQRLEVLAETDLSDIAGLDIELRLVRALGVSIHDRPRAGRLAESSPLDLLMIRYNAAHRGAEQEAETHQHPDVESRQGDEMGQPGGAQAPAPGPG